MLAAMAIREHNQLITTKQRYLRLSEKILSIEE
jgi:hypothetical protein